MLMLLFYCGQDCFALDCASVVEVFPKVHIQNIPGSSEVKPHYLTGLFNLGGTPIPVIDLCQCIERREASPSMHTRLVLVQHPTKPKQLVALMAEKVTETQDLDPSQFQNSGLYLKGLPFLQGVYSEGDKTIQLFDLNSFFQTVPI